MMIMIIAIIYIVLYYVIFDQHLKITFRKSSALPEKIHSPLFTHSLPKNSKSASLPFFANTENFSGVPAEGGTLCMCNKFQRLENRFT